MIVPKSNGKIRVCGDFKVTINQCAETKSYPLPTTEDIFAHLAGGRVFSKLDLSQAYLQLPVDEECKDLLVINAPKGTIDYCMGYPWHQQYSNLYWILFCTGYKWLAILTIC